MAAYVQVRPPWNGALLERHSVVRPAEWPRSDPLELRALNGGLLVRQERRGGALCVHGKNPNEDSNSDPLWSRSVPGIPDFWVGYPVILLASTLVVPVTTALLFGLAFAGYAALGRVAVPKEDYDYDDDEDDDEDVQVSTDVLALGAAIATAGLLAPANDATTILSMADDDPSWLALVSALAVAASVAIGGSSLVAKEDRDEDDLSNAEQELMNLWDKDLMQSTTTPAADKINLEEEERNS